VTVGLYTRFRALWQDGSAGGTPITAAALNHIEDGIVAASDHGTLAGLADDHHPHYLLRTDASAIYLAKADNLAALVDKAAARANLGADAAYLLRNEAKNAFTTTSETTTSTTYADLATIGPEVTVNIRDDGSGTGRALFIVGGRLTNNTVGQQCFMSVAGAALPATDSTALANTAEASSNLLIASHVFIAGGLTPGSRTYTAKYRVTGGTGTFSARRLTVIPL
jgi:hypothetical protein